jgi:hypothetical protein
MPTRIRRLAILIGLALAVLLGGPRIAGTQGVEQWLAAWMIWHTLCPSTGCSSGKYLCAYATWETGDLTCYQP